MVNGCPFSFGILVEKLIHAACGKVMDLRKSEPDICGKFGICAADLIKSVLNRMGADFSVAQREAGMYNKLVTMRNDAKGHMILCFMK